MKKIKNAFTLIELLAVIIILAIVALIATPIILDVVEDARISAGKSEAQMILGGINNYCASSEMKKQMGTLGSDDIDCSIKTSFTEEEIGKMLNLGNATVISNSYSNGKVTGLVIKSNNHTFTLCSSGQFAMDDEECGAVAVLTTGPIKDVVLSNFPYLATNGNGCVTSTSNNYSYMGGCYLKGGSQSGKDIFVAGLNGAPGLDSIDIINEKFFDSEGNFIEENFENWALTDGGISEDELTSAGVDTVFELIYQTTPENLFVQKGLNNSLWYSGFLWRIMGINRDGTVRLITDENVTAIPWGARNTAQNWDDSYAKNWLNNYFYSRLKGNNIIKEETWCSETTTDSSSTRTTCTNNLSTEKSKVGLLTLDEYNLAGGISSYLNIGQWQWTMTPYNSSLAWYVGSGGDASSDDVSSTDGLRAVINVNSVVTITGGNGTLGATWSSEAGPYVLNEDKNVEVTGKLNEKATSGEYVLFAGRKYRVVDKDSNGNTKLILDGYYEEDGNIFEMEYNETSTNEFSVTTGIGQKLNGDVLNWLVQESDTTNRNKLVSNYTWYQNNFGFGQSYTISLNEENPTRSIQATLGLIRVGEMLSSQSSSILTKGYTTTSSYNNAYRYWTMTPYTSSSNAWGVDSNGSANNNGVSFTSGLRAVIVVNSGVTITSGNGTWSSPYQI